MAVASVFQELMHAKKYTLELHGQRYERTYLVPQSDPYWAARLYGPAMGDLYAGNIRVVNKTADVAPDGEHCILTVVYQNESDKDDRVGSSETQFDTSAATEHIIKALSQSHPKGTNVGNLVNASQKGVDGVDLQVAQFTWQEVWWFEDVTTAMINKYWEITGTINKYAWKQFEIAEALCMGVVGQKKSGERWEVTFRFSGSKTKTVTIAAAETVDGAGWSGTKRGWDYIWYETDTVVALGIPIPKIKGIHLARIYAEEDFSDLGIGS